MLVRTDFSEDGLWQEVLRSTVDEEVDEPYYPQFTVVDDPCFDGLTIEGIVAAVRPDRSYVFIADARTMTDPEHPLLVVDTSTEAVGHRPGQSVRVTQPVIETVESNLAIANVDFVDIVRSAEADGVYRGADLRGEQPAVQSISLSVIREAVARRSDVPTFATAPGGSYGLDGYFTRDFRELLGAGLIDTMHVAVAPVELGRGERLWPIPDERTDRFHLETIPSTSGVAHHLFWRR